ncbi:MAG: orange carotenoid protein N-terminal domain-containing protein [Coleofasciculus sp. G3-WIS-01]|uniref:orange carotenoid protein N-terminal domain-containing protein n=1 Tax=Coleofasciculus sp. G3-WIS-01 TaxID=3069528 RepID=UPI0032F0F976
MMFITNRPSTSTLEITPAVNQAVKDFQRLSVDDQLGLLWGMYQNLGCSLAPTPAGAARLFLTQGLLHQIKQMPSNEQLGMMHGLLRETDTPISRQYGLFTLKTKLAFWTQLFDWMSTGEVSPVAITYPLSSSATSLLRAMASLELNEQISLFHWIVEQMGVAPLAA